MKIEIVANNDELFKMDTDTPLLLPEDIRSMQYTEDVEIVDPARTEPAVVHTPKVKAPQGVPFENHKFNGPGFFEGTSWEGKMQRPNS